MIALILQVASTPSRWGFLETRPLFAGGAISYGIYMLHGTAIIVAVGPLTAWLGTDGIAFNVALYTVALGGTIALATASYLLLERPFLRLKRRLGRLDMAAETGATGPDVVRSEGLVRAASAS